MARKKLPWEKDYPKLPWEDKKKEETPKKETEDEFVGQTKVYREGMSPTGEIKAVEFPDGRVFSGLSEKKLISLAESRAPSPTPAGAVEVSDIRAQEEQARQEEERQREALEVAEETGVFEERPERVELTPTEEELKQHPSTFKRFLFGSPINEASKIIFGKSIFGKEEESINDLMENPETLRATMIQEIQRDELDRSLTDSQKLGGVLEPYLGDLKVFDVDVGGYIDQWIQMPQKDVNTIVEQIAEVESSVSGMTDSASQGEIGNPAEVLRDIDEKERTLAIYEARIKKLILQSDELKANPEKVRLIEEKILSARETFFEAKQRAAEGALVTPTDSQLFLKLKEIREK